MEEQPGDPQPLYKDYHLQHLHMVSLHGQMRSREIEQWQRKAARILGRVRRAIAAIEAHPHPIDYY